MTTIENRNLNLDEPIFTDIDPDANLLDHVIPHDMCKHYSLCDLEKMNEIRDDFSIVNYNVRSFHSNGNAFIGAINAFDLRFDCIVLTETWNTDDNCVLCNIPGYTSFHTYRPKNHLYSSSGGVSILCNDVTINHKTFNSDLSICDANIETCVLDLFFGKRTITIVAVYRPPQGCKQQFLTELERILDLVNINSNQIILLGDINLNLLLSDEPRICDYMSMLYSKSMFSLIDKPTRYPPDLSSTVRPSLLDHIWTNYYNVLNCGLIDYDKSDHLPVYCVLKISSFTCNYDKIKIESRPFSEENLTKLTNALNNTNWDEILDYDDPENSIDIFSNKLNSLYVKFFPLKVKHVSDKRLKNKWITREVKVLINKKSDACKKMRNGDISRKQNNRIKNDVNQLVNKAKHDYFINSLKAYQNNMKKSWKIVHDLMGKKKSKHEIMKILDDNNEIEDSKEIVNKFADFFSNVGLNLDNNLAHNDNSPLSYIDRNPHSFYLFNVTVDECLKIISKLKLTRTSMNHIPISIFKNIKELIAPTLTKLINSSFHRGIFPNSMKKARVTPIFKKGDSKLCSNYRPISSLPFLSKIYERLMANRIVSFFNKHSLFSEKQYGFLKGRSTQDALLNFAENIYDALNAKSFNISVLIDLKSAFDTVNHSILLSKLELYGIRGHPLNWFKSYLSDRKFSVSLSGSSSPDKTVNIGIPQGSILGPLLFIIYNNELPKVSKVLSTTLFADDTNFSISSNSYDNLVYTLNEELDKIENWTVANRLTINTSKTELLMFTNRQFIFNDVNVVLGGVSLEFSDHARFLGVIVDDKMSFKLHIQNINEKVSKHAGILYRIRNNLPLFARMRYYNSFIMPYLTYNIIHWGNTNDTHLEPLFLTQKRIVRSIVGAQYLDSSTPLFHRLKILKLKDLFKFHAALDTYKKLKNGHYDITHNINTRNIHLAQPKYHRLTRTQQSITFCGPTIWNSLPSYIQNTSTLPLLKDRLKEFLLDQYSPGTVPRPHI